MADPAHPPLKIGYISYRNVQNTKTYTHILFCQNSVVSGDNALWRSFNAPPPSPVQKFLDPSLHPNIASVAWIKIHLDNSHLNSYSWRYCVLNQYTQYRALEPSCASFLIVQNPYEGKILERKKFREYSLFTDQR